MQFYRNIQRINPWFVEQRHKSQDGFEVKSLEGSVCKRFNPVQSRQYLEYAEIYVDRI